MRLLHTLILCTLVSLTVACNQEEQAEEKDFTEAMAKEHAEDTPTGNQVAWLQPATSVKAEKIAYATIDQKPVNGYFVAPTGTGTSPTAGVVVIHEWWGLNENVEAMARRIAGDGYMALAVDLYNGNVAENADSAKAFMKAATEDPDKGIDNLRQAIALLKERGATQIGVVGWCFGGGWSLKTGMNFPDDIDATVIYYGHLETDPEQLKKLNMPVLGIFGENDGGIPVDEVKAFESALNSLEIENSINIYPGAEHAFANPSGKRYNAEAAEDAWEKTTAFLAEHLKK